MDIVQARSHVCHRRREKHRTPRKDSIEPSLVRKNDMLSKSKRGFSDLKQQYIPERRRAPRVLLVLHYCFNVAKT